MKTICSKRTISSKISQIISLPLILVTLILLSACGGQDARSEPEYFIPPTVAVKPVTPTPEVTETPLPEPTQDVLCVNNLSYVADVTIEDDTIVAPGQEITKIWLVRNSGSCNWEADYTLRNVDGSPMGSSTILPLYPVRSGGEYEIALDLIAPTDDGQHISRWQAHDPEGNPFGQDIFLQIIVDTSLVEDGN